VLHYRGLRHGVVASQYWRISSSLPSRKAE
jgi:hypothetical protein